MCRCYDRFYKMKNYVLLTLIINFYRGSVAKVLDLKELTYYEIVEPNHVGIDGIRRDRRDLSTFLVNKNKHLDETAYEFSGHNRNFLLRIYKNDLLIPESLVKIHQDTDGSYLFNKGIEHCYYHGYLSDRVSSTAAVSTCYGLKGVIKDEDDEEFVIEPHPDNKATDSSKYVLYRSKDVVTTRKMKCGVNTTTTTEHHHDHHIPSFYDEVYGVINSKSFVSVENTTEHRRSRRSASVTKFVEVTLIMDNLEFKHFKDVNRTQHRGLEILNFVDSYYKTINTRIVITNLIVWNVANMASVTGNAGATLDALEIYTRDVLFGEMKLNFDNAQLISRANWGMLAGLAGVNIVCAFTSSSVTQDHGRAHETANTVAHEMGHNIGFLHYKCGCPNGPCVMSSGAPSAPCKGFAPCTRTHYLSKLAAGDLPCLLDYPDRFFQEPKCGNGLLEKGEACDCGTEAECLADNTAKCCDFKTCKLKSTSQCDKGQCCKDCMFKPKGTLCRKKMNQDCDLEEYCTGNSNYCPENFYIQDGRSCKNDTSYCYQGTCKTHDTECEMLWGPNAKKAEDICFKVNLESANGWGSCGKNNKDQFIKCAPGDQLCGKMQCRAKSKDVSLPRFPVIGTNRAKKTVTYWIGPKTVLCIQGMTSVSPDLDDPTITGPGIKCANNSICLSHKCTNISTLNYIKKCAKPCLHGGICNNNGHCHCNNGYACPFCELRGPGGSEDSGQGCIRPCENCLSSLSKAMLIFFLLVVPLLVLMLFLLYRNREWIRLKCGHQSPKVIDECVAAQVQTTKQISNEQSVGSVDNPYMSYDEGDVTTSTKDISKPSRPAPPIPHSQHHVSSDLPNVGC